MRSRTALAALAAAVLLSPGIGRAQDYSTYPTKPITLVVPFPAGGGNDALARVAAERLSRDARPAGRGREPRRRRRHHRDARGREKPARRLHHPAVLHRHARDQPEPLSQRRLRSAQGLRADRPDRVAAERAGGQSQAARDHRRGTDRLRQGQPRQDQLRVRAGHGRPHHHRAVRQDRGHRAHQHPLQGQRQRARRPARRARLDDVPVDRADHRQRQGRAPCARWR